MRHIVGAIVIWCAAFSAAFAQSGPQSGQAVWIQVEAVPSLREAEERVRAYAALLPDVAGFQISSRWYGIALGPYSRPDATRVLASLRENGQIPGDSYLAEGNRFQRQFWPIGANDLTSAVVAPAPSVPAELEAVSTTSAPPAPIAAPDETPREARASEGLLSRDEKRLLQTALQWAGFYNSTIDGLFGRGTRASMAAWQEANAYEATGILTTAQRAALLGEYNAILDGLGLQRVAETQAGLELSIPTEQVAFKEYEPPFVHYQSSGDLGVQLSLISQEGSRERFQGLYNVLQTLDIVPTEGPRNLARDRFTITGTDATRHTTIDVSYTNGAMKGFMLVWPANDTRRLSRVLDEMRASVTLLPGTLDPAIAPPDESQSIDLLAGLDIRQPSRTLTGFYVDRQGAILTASEPLAACERISVGPDADADIVFADADTGLALLRPQDAVAPLGVATFQSAVPRLRDEVAVAGFSFGGTLSAPTLTLGALEDLRGVNGDESVKRLSLLAEAGDSGGPVFDQGGAVIGLLRPVSQPTGQVLPETVRFAVDVDTIRAAMTAQGVSITETNTPAVMDKIDLSALAADVSVLVECW